MKITTRFEFPLEINMKEYYDLEGNEIINDDDFLYELYGVIVHSGTPYAGHYFSYIRDMTGQGNWKLDEIPIVNENINNNKNTSNNYKSSGNSSFTIIIIIFLSIFTGIIIVYLVIKIIFKPKQIKANELEDSFSYKNQDIIKL